jgi:hypothetical protein
MQPEHSALLPNPELRPAKQVETVVEPMQPASPPNLSVNPRQDSAESNVHRTQCAEKAKQRHYVKYLQTKSIFFFFFVFLDSGDF